MWGVPAAPPTSVVDSSLGTRNSLPTISAHNFRRQLACPRNDVGSRAKDAHRGLGFAPGRERERKKGI